MNKVILIDWGGYMLYELARLGFSILTLIAVVIILRGTCQFWPHNTNNNVA